MVTYNTPAEYRFGSVGKPVPECEVKIGENDEILVRGPNVMVGSHNRPEETAEALADGWFHTGDQGRFDDDGYLFITGRIKDLIITAGGKNVAPQQIEAAVGRDDLIGQAVAVGDRRKYIVALVAPSFEALETWAAEHGVDAGDRETLVSHPEVQALYRDRIEAQSKELAQYERIQRFALLPHELTMEAGELTPTLKVKRPVVEERYADLIEELYRQG